MLRWGSSCREGFAGLRQRRDVLHVMAQDVTIWAARGQSGLAPATDIRGKATARSEGATGPQGTKIGGTARYCADILVPRLSPNSRGQHPPRIRMRGPQKHVFGGAIFDNPARIHDRNLVSDLRSNPQIMGHEDCPHAKVLLQLFEQDQNLNLNSCIQRGGGFIRQQKLRVAL